MNVVRVPTTAYGRLLRLERRLKLGRREVRNAELPQLRKLYNLPQHAEGGLKGGRKVD